ncbi:MAG: type II secretion system F family protein [Arcobacteraceae bacterium]|jgi:type II secretory pathway component PulF|nr:type II secretion system F family protein [Arcobacteraceae bacterium]
MRYKITYIKNGQIVTQTVPKHTKDEISASYEVLKTEAKSGYNLPIFRQNTDVLFKELSIIVNSSLSFSDAVELLLKNTKNSYHQEILQDMKDGLNKGENIDEVLAKHKNTVGILPILFFRIGFVSGDIGGALQNLVMLLEFSKQSKKRLISALSYPLLVMFFFVVAMVIIFNFVVPQFENMYEQFDSKLPFVTQTLLFTKDFVVEYGVIFVVLNLIFAFIINVKMKNSLDFKLKIDKILFSNIPVISKFVSLWQIHRIFLTFSSLLESKYTFAQSLQSTQMIVTNTYVLSQLASIENHIKSGSSINIAFERSGIFDELTNRLIYSGEISNTIPQVIKELEKIYYAKLDDRIKFLSATVEPVFLLFMGIAILWLISALMLPIWDMGNIIR